MNTKRIYIALVIIIILLIPYATNAPWTATDYIVGAALLLITGTVFDIVTSRFANQKKRLLAGFGVLLVAVYVWAELAVGIFTNLGS